MRFLPVVALVLAACGKDDTVVPESLTVVSTVPVDGAVEVSPQTSIRVRFDGGIDPGSLNAESFALDPPVGGAFAWDAASDTVTFTPDADLASGAVSVSLTAAIRGSGGVSLTPYDFGFTVGGGGTTQTGVDSTWSDGVDTTTVVVTDHDTLERSYTLSTTHPQRDGWPQQVTFEELPDQPVLRSGSDLFDALFALAVHESRVLSVGSITDGAFSNGAPIACDCFETGDLWPYVWTRDTAYAADLGTALIDPQRAANSLLFKISADKPAVGAGGLQIVQDTGTGGSWPVSTDRVVWARGAARVLATLDGSARTAFRDQALEAVVNTAEVDRVHVWDPDDGLYRGETSFLDWREQTYPQWTASDVRHIAESKSLSTNVGHWTLLDLAARLSGEVGDSAGEARYRGWADDLAAAIDAGFWDGTTYARALPNQLDPAPQGQQDLLGLALAALTVADPVRANAALAAYPHGAHGPPVIWPQQPMVPIYHNRAIWPFVTAYDVRAAAKLGNDAVVTRGVHSLTRGALLNLSNLENLEVLSGRNWVDDGAYSGPVVNSHMQLWSVAGYLGMVFDLFGVSPEADGLHVAPFLPEDVAATWMGTGEVTLHRLTWRGRTFDLTLVMPATDFTGPMVAGSIEVDGAPATSPLSASDLGNGSVVRVTLAHAGPTGAALTEIVDDGDFRKVWAPRDPSVTGLADVGGSLELTLDTGGEAGVVFDVWRDGVEVATGVTGPTWVDPGSGDLAVRSACYAVNTRFETSGHRSQRSWPVCWLGAAGERVQRFDAYALSPLGGGSWNGGANPFWNDWGAAGGSMKVAGVRPARTGRHLLRVVHANGSGPINTGLAAANKHLIVRDPAGVVVAEGSVAMPQSGAWGNFRDSTGLFADLDASRVYELELVDAPNMSWLQGFANYTAGLGGGGADWNRADLMAVELVALEGADPVVVPPLAAFDGVDDLGKLGAGQQVGPGAALQPWEAVAIDWDDEAVYVAWVSQAFEADYVPVVVYLEATVGVPGAAVPSVGFEYSGLIPELPFTPTHAISLRALSDDGSAFGPWDGVRVPEGVDWRTTRRFLRDRESWLAADRHTLSARIPRDLLGGATHLRLVAHVVNAVPGSEWVDVVPADHTPWAAGGGWYQIDLSGSHDPAAW